MILIVASAVDETAVEFAEELSASIAATVVTCEALATESTVLRYPDFLSSAFTVRGQRVAVRDVRAVVNLLPAVFPDELFFYPSEEREYQAAEFHALLVFFMTALSCPVINRPTSTSLTGGPLGQMGWYQLARKISIPVADIEFKSDEFANPFAKRCPEETLEVSYLHGKLLAVDVVMAEEYTRMLAEFANLEYLRATFVRRAGELRLKAASTVPALRDMPTRDLFIRHLTAIGETR